MAYYGMWLFRGREGGLGKDGILGTEYRDETVKAARLEPGLSHFITHS